MSTAPHRAYQRYGGLMQFTPLTIDEQRYDDTCRQIDQLEVDIGAMPAVLFTANELLWFVWFVSKTFFGPSQAQLDRQLAELRKLKKALQSRAPAEPRETDR